MEIGFQVIFLIVNGLVCLVMHYLIVSRIRPGSLQFNLTLPTIHSNLIPELIHHVKIPTPSRCCGNHTTRINNFFETNIISPGSCQGKATANRQLDIFFDYERNHTFSLYGNSLPI